jgi:hypothetical protein
MKVNGNRIGKWVIGACLAGIAGSAHAFIPPTYRVTILSEDRQARSLAHSLVEYMAAEEAFFWRRDLDFRSAARTCFRGEAAEPCLREAIGKAAAEPGLWTAAIVVTPASDGRQQWQCIGAGAKPAPAGTVNVTIDLQTALFGSGEARTANLRAALTCIQEAANEASSQ